MRKSLKLFRVGLNLTQAEMAEKIGCGRAMYSYVENGKRAGRQMFWNSLQKAFDIPDEEMYGLMKNED